MFGEGGSKSFEEDTYSLIEMLKKLCHEKPYEILKNKTHTSTKNITQSTTDAAFKESNDQLIYIVVVLLFYSFSIIIVMVKHMRIQKRCADEERVIEELLIARTTRRPSLSTVNLLYGKRSSSIAIGSSSNIMEGMDAKSKWKALTKLVKDSSYFKNASPNKNNTKLDKPNSANINEVGLIAHQVKRGNVNEVMAVPVKRANGNEEIALQVIQEMESEKNNEKHEQLFSV